MNLEDEKSWSFFMPQVKLSLLAGILLQQPPSLGGLERFDLYGHFKLACAYSPYKFVLHQRMWHIAAKWDLWELGTYMGPKSKRWAS